MPGILPYPDLLQHLPGHILLFVLLQPTAPPEKHEFDTAKYFANLEKDIYFLKPSDIPETHTPDIIMDGQEWEIKCPQGSSKRTIEQNFRQALPFECSEVLPQVVTSWFFLVLDGSTTCVSAILGALSIFIPVYKACHDVLEIDSVHLLYTIKCCQSHAPVISPCTCCTKPGIRRIRFIPDRPVLWGHSDQNLPDHRIRDQRPRALLPLFIKPKHASIFSCNYFVAMLYYP